MADVVVAGQLAFSWSMKVMTEGSDQLAAADSLRE
jgi:hypothetical protein